MSPPSAFGTYRVLHQIGSGVLGPVFRAYDSQQDRLVAIKTFKLDLVPEAASRLADRLRALASVRPAHPAVVGAVDAGLAGATPFIALEYASGEPLDALLRQSGAWPMTRALPVLREIAAAIDASWAANVGHGALHPRDIFVEVGSPDVRVTGFGISQAIEDAGAKAPVRRPYSAPERGEGTPWDIRADVYSLGVVAFEMLSGQRPLGPDDDGVTIAADLAADARAAVRRVLAVAMADGPADRYETATAFVDALAGADAGREDVGGGFSPGENSADVGQGFSPGETGGAEAPPHTEEVPPTAETPRRPARVRRPRPVALELPLLEVVEADAPPEPVNEPPPAAEPAAEPEPEPAPVFMSSPGPEPPPAPEPRLRDVPVESEPVPSLPKSDFGGAEAPPYMEREDRASFPWMAVIAVFAAGLALGGVVMYQLGWRRGSDAARQAAAASAPAATPAAAVTPAAEPSPTEPALPVAAAPAKPSPSPRASVSPEAAPGRLVIQSVPAGALVTIDGRRAGETPVTVSVPLGRHEIQIARPGYVPHNERVELTKKSASRTLRVQLKRGAGGAAPEARR